MTSIGRHSTCHFAPGSYFDFCSGSILHVPLGPDSSPLDRFFPGEPPFSSPTFIKRAFIHAYAACPVRFPDRARACLRKFWLLKRTLFLLLPFFVSLSIYQLAHVGDAPCIRLQDAAAFFVFPLILAPVFCGSSDDRVFRPLPKSLTSDTFRSRFWHVARFSSRRHHFSAVRCPSWCRSALNGAGRPAPSILR